MYIRIMNDLKVGVACNTQKIDLPQDNRQGQLGYSQYLQDALWARIWSGSSSLYSYVLATIVVSGSFHNELKAGDRAGEVPL